MIQKKEVGEIILSSLLGRESSVVGENQRNHLCLNGSRYCFPKAV